MDLKPALSIDEQLNLLKYRGMIFKDENFARDFLLDNNYYRLNIYFHKNMEPGNNKFRENTLFDDIIKIYISDSSIRNYLLPSLENAEITFRARLAYHLANTISPSAFYDQSIYSTSNDYNMAQQAFLKEINRNTQDPRIVHHNTKYNGVFPIWVVVEFLSFNSISKLYNGLIPNIKKDIARKYYFLNEEYLSSWLHSVSVLRNICAHYGYLYRRLYKNRPKLGTYFSPWKKTDNQTLMAQLLVLRKICGASVFEETITKIEYEFKNNSVLSIKDYGLPNDWNTILLNVR